MDFGTFVAVFGNGYSFMKNTRKIVPDEPPIHNKKSFCRELLFRITTDDKYVLHPNGDTESTPRSLQAFEAYYRNSKRRSLHPIAAPIIHKCLLDDEGFHDFLKEYTKHYSKDILLKSFQKYIPETSLETLFDDITDAFIQILRKAASEPDRRRKTSEPLLPNANSETKPPEESEQIDDASRKQAESAHANDITDAFYTAYDKKMSLSNISPGIKTEIWKTITEIITDCQRFKTKTKSLLNIVEYLKQAKDNGIQVFADDFQTSADENQAGDGGEQDKAKNERAMLASVLATYPNDCIDIENMFYAIINKWGSLYSTYAHIVEIRELTQISFADLVSLPPDNRCIHMAGSSTDVFIEKLRQISEDYLFT